MSQFVPARRRRLAWVLAVAATLALLQPTMSVLSPGLAGWQPGHDHVFTSDAAARAPAHSHPYDAGSDHHDHEHAHAAAEDAAGASGDGGVIFVFDGSVAGTALPQTSSPAAETPGWQRAPGRAAPIAQAADVSAPIPPPPRA